MKATILVVTNRTAASEDLLAALQARAGRGPARFEFVMPPERETPEARAEARARLEEALELAREAGLEVAGHVGACDALSAVVDAYDPPPPRRDPHLHAARGTSHWLRIDLPARVARATGALVSHVAWASAAPRGPSRRPAWRPRGRVGPHPMRYAYARDGTRLAYDVAGPGPGAPAVLLVMGLAFRGVVWGETRDVLAAAGYRTITMDNRGVGESEPATFDFSTSTMADDAVEVLRQERIAARTWSASRSAG
jgi:hypothetical protein